MIQLFLKGGPIMWPLLATSLVALTVAIERLFFIVGERFHRQPDVVGRMLLAVSNADVEQAIQIGEKSKDFIARLLTRSLKHRDRPIANILLHASNCELARYNSGLNILDTVITLAPLLGLLGTVTGMIHSFGLLGGEVLHTPTAITGGIAEALLATAFGLGVAILTLIPYNYFNACLEKARLQIQDATFHVEMAFMTRTGTSPCASRNATVTSVV